MTTTVITPARLSIVVAVSENGVIGKGDALPWKIASELKYFKSITHAKPIIMGSNTWDSLPKKPLPGRLNLILSRDLRFEAEGAFVCASVFEALELAREHALEEGCEDICIIGGANIYAQTLKLVQRLYVSRIHTTIEDDNTGALFYFPVIDTSQWLEIHSEFHARSDDDAFDFTTYIYDRL